MKLKFSACDARSLGMLHMDVHCQDLGFLHLMHLSKIKGPTTMLLGTYHCGFDYLSYCPRYVWDQKIFGHGKDASDMD